MPRTYRAEMGVPPMPDEGAPGPADMLGNMTIGKASDLTPAKRKQIMRDMPMEPVEGEEVGMEKKQAKIYKKKFSSGGYTKAADGICQRGKTRGKMV